MFPHLGKVLPLAIVLMLTPVRADACLVLLPHPVFYPLDGTTNVPLDARVWVSLTVTEVVGGGGACCVAWLRRSGHPS